MRSVPTRTVWIGLTIPRMPFLTRRNAEQERVPEAALELLWRLHAEAKDSSGIVFAGPDGKRMDQDHFDEFACGRISVHAGLSGIRFHDLRHFFVSMLIAQGESAEYVCDQSSRSRFAGPRLA